MTIHSLPQDIIQTIFYVNEPAYELLNQRSVCKLWNNLIPQNPRWNESLELIKKRNIVDIKPEDTALQNLHQICLKLRSIFPEFFTTPSEILNNVEGALNTLDVTKNPNAAALAQGLNNSLLKAIDESNYPEIPKILEKARLLSSVDRLNLYHILYACLTENFEAAVEIVKFMRNINLELYFMPYKRL